MEISKMPIKQYAASSSIVVTRFAAQLFRSETENICKGLPSRACKEMPVISCIWAFNDTLSPSRLPSEEKNSTEAGASSSCNVQPRVNHLLSRKARSHVFVALSPLFLLFVETSARKT